MLVPWITLIVARVYYCSAAPWERQNFAPTFDWEDWEPTIGIRIRWLLSAPEPVIVKKTFGEFSYLNNSQSLCHIRGNLDVFIAENQVCNLRISQSSMIISLSKLKISYLTRWLTLLSNIGIVWSWFIEKSFPICIWALFVFFACVYIGCLHLKAKAKVRNRSTTDY